MVRRISAVMLIAGMALFLARTAPADDFHYTNLLIGDRASGMGGAYTAVSDDATGLYYNPAGIAYTAGGNLSASVNAYYNNEKTYKGVIGGNGWTRRSSSLLPNYFGVIQPVGRFKVGFSYAVPDSIMEDQSQTFGNLPLSTSGGSNSVASLNPGVNITSYIINFNNENNVYEFGPSIATEFSDNFSAGLTLYYYWRKELWVLNQIIKTSNGGFEWTNQYFHANERGVRPILGFMWSPVKNVSLGLAVSKIWITSSDTNFQSSYVREGLGVFEDTNGGGIPDTVVYDKKSIPDGPSDTTARRDYPTKVGLGIAWFPSQSLLLTGDLNYYTKVNEQIVTIGGQSVILRPAATAVTNVALGTEYYFTRNWAMRAGAFTNMANTPNIQSGAANQNEHIDLYGATASISNFTRNTSVTLGTALTYGSGKAQIISGSSAIQDAVSQGWMIFLSSAYAY